LVDQVTYFNKTVASKDMSGYYLLKNGEYAYNKSYSVGYDFGSIKRLDRYEMGALSTLYICFALTKHDSDFIKTYFDSLKWYKEIYMIAAEGARNHGLLNVPTDDFFATQHILPNNEQEQHKIAQFLGLLETRIEKQRQLVDALKSYKRGLINSIIDGNIHPHKEHSPWINMTVGEAFVITRGNVLPISETRSRKSSTFCYPVYSSQTKDDGLMGFYSEYLYENCITWTTDGANAGCVKYRAGKFYCTNVCGVLLEKAKQPDYFIAEVINRILTVNNRVVDKSLNHA
jgi:Restriction endonuclease S subunits